MSSEELKYDKRIVRRNLQKGVISEKELEKHDKDLKDVSDDYEVIEAELRYIQHRIPDSGMNDEDEL